MPRKLHAHVYREKTRHGRAVWYFRRGKGARTRLPGEYDSPEFMEAYHAALAGSTVQRARPTAKPNTLRWLVDRYRESSDFIRLAASTKRVRERLLIGLCDTAGDALVQHIDRKTILAGRERRAETPEAANTFVKTMRVLLDYAVTANLIERNPARDVKMFTSKTGGIHTWTVDEVARYEARHPVGTKARLALDILLYTGLRRSDAVTLGRQHVKNEILNIRTRKTGEVVTLRILPPLRASLDASKTGDLTYLVTEYGKAFTGDGFGNWFRDRCAEAGVPGSAHGLRKAAASRAAEAGATTSELMAMFGWQSSKQAELYTRAANRAAMGVQASDKLQQQKQNKTPAP